MIYVIGSGPSGISAAFALVNRGLNVTMLDAGFELEPELTQIVRKLRLLDKKSWDDHLIGEIKKNMSGHSGGVEFKPIFSSDYPYRGIDTYQPVKLNGAKMCRSLGKGGLSTVWGASILPFRQNDIPEWPITIQDLEPYYKNVLAFMFHSGENDKLCDLFPLYDKHSQPFSLCKQAAGLLDDLYRNNEALNEQNIFFGHSRLAVNFLSNQNGPECAYCGMCLYGCPYAKIYSSMRACIHSFGRLRLLSNMGATHKTKATSKTNLMT